jgi:hypothetical protein
MQFQFRKLLPPILFKGVECIRVELLDHDHVGQILQFDVNANFTMPEPLPRQYR